MRHKSLPAPLQRSAPPRSRYVLRTVGPGGRGAPSDLPQPPANFTSLEGSVDERSFLRMRLPACLTSRFLPWRSRLACASPAAPRIVGLQLEQSKCPCQSSIAAKCSAGYAPASLADLTAKPARRTNIPSQEGFSVKPTKQHTRKWKQGITPGKLAACPCLDVFGWGP